MARSYFVQNVRNVPSKMCAQRIGFSIGTCVRRYLISPVAHSIRHDLIGVWDQKKLSGCTIKTIYKLQIRGMVEHISGVDILGHTCRACTLFTLNRAAMLLF